MGSTPIRAIKMDIIKAHKHSRNNKAEIEKSKVCGCFYCSAIFPPDKITSRHWIDKSGNLDKDGENATALCPYCGIDSVIGDASGFPVNDFGFMLVMGQHWFSNP